MNATHPRLGAMLGYTADASGATGYQDFAGQPDGFQSGSSAVDAGTRAQQDFGGRMSAGMLGVAVLVLLGFYLYTRKYQG